MDTAKRIENFKLRIRDRVFLEYVKTGSVSTRLHIVGFHETDGWVGTHMNIPDTLNLDTDEFDLAYARIQRITKRFISRFEEDGHRPILLCHVESGCSDGTENIFLSFKTGEEFDDVEIDYYKVESDPMAVDPEGVLVETTPRFIKVS